MYNLTFDLEKISQEYQSKGYFSRKIVSKAMSNVIKTIKDKCLKYIDKNSVCLEIAPGSGDMVNALINEVKFIYTVDPSLVSLEIKNVNNLEHIQGFFDCDILKSKLEYKINFIIFRHLLEHINTPLDFLQNVVNLLENNGIIYVEVPNFSKSVQYSRFYDIYNDHCGYYSKNTIINIMLKFNFVLLQDIILHNGDILGLIFKKEAFKLQHAPYPIELFNNITENFNFNIQKLNISLTKYNSIGIYGAGSQGCSLPCFIDQINCIKIKKCFDLDKRKQGMYLQNSSIIIQEPNIENLKDVEIIVIAAPLYEKEIIKSLREKGYKGDIIAIEKEIKIL
ncbi:class I SAM-dependent methyltransferase [Campylobacter molothri]|uniref:class I SAM-dependent methyltransferase n=1 Tax=Campylobacter molothri TaxID=1032242 RepID=UPI00301CFB20